MSKPVKPLGIKAYGSIGHLPDSRLGPGDHMVHPGQATICTEKPRRGDEVFVTEKLDGACMSVANIDGNIVALSRAGYRATDALYPHLRLFDDYVNEHHADFAALLAPGERVCGEWLAMAHGTLYDPGDPNFAPFVAFDLFRDSRRVLRREFAARVSGVFPTATTLSDGPMTTADAMASLCHLGFHGATEPAEGAVWRVEREGRVDFLAKFVRSDKVDGKYLPEISGQPAVWFWQPQKVAA